MLKKAPPLFQGSSPDRTGILLVSDPTDDTWWNLANDIANAALGAQSLTALDVVRHCHTDDFARLKASRRDLARTVSEIVARRRQELEQGR